MCFFKKEPKPLWLLLKLSSTLCRDLKTNKKCWYYYYCCYDETKTWQTNIHTYLESFMLLEMHTLYMIIYTTLKLLRMTSILIFSLYLYLLALLLFLFTFFTRQKKTTLRDPLLMMALLLCNALGKKTSLLHLCKNMTTSKKHGVHFLNARDKKPHDLLHF